MDGVARWHNCIYKYRYKFFKNVLLLFVSAIFILPVSCVGISEPDIQASINYETAGKPGPDIEWSRTYGSRTYEDAAFHIILNFAQQTTDGGYIIGGHKSDYSFFLLKTDVGGNQLWERSFGDEKTGYFDQGEQTADGGYIMCGKYNDESVYLLKTDKDGNTLWDKKIVSDKNLTVLQIQQTADGGYIICADIDQGRGIAPLPSIIKTDADGNKLWEETFGIADGCLVESVQQTGDGGYIVGGNLSVLDGDTMWLIKTDPNGKQLWHKIYNKNSGRCHSVQETMDGGYIVCGVRHVAGMINLMLTKTDKDGNELWTKLFDGISPAQEKPVQQTMDGGYILCGCSAYLGFDESWLIKTDADGNVLWDKKFGSRNNEVTVYSVQQTTDGGYILCGKAEVEPSPYKKVHIRKYNVLLVKSAPWP